jgi:hypothetical protein
MVICLRIFFFFFFFFFLKYGRIFYFIFSSYYIQHCFICRPSDSTVPTDAGIEPRTVATGALAVRRSVSQQPKSIVYKGGYEKGRGCKERAVRHLKFYYNCMIHLKKQSQSLRICTKKPLLQWLVYICT